MLKEKIGKMEICYSRHLIGTFCEGKDFDYKKTQSKCGLLSNIALKRDDFLRTKNPIYSFAVTGKRYGINFKFGT